MQEETRVCRLFTRRGTPHLLWCGLAPPQDIVGGLPFETVDANAAMHDTTVLVNQHVALRIGDRVRIRGLRKRVELNAKFGIVVSVPAEPDGRFGVEWEVIVDGEPGSGVVQKLMMSNQAVGIKRDNLEVAPPRLPHDVLLASTHGRLDEVVTYLDSGGDIEAIHALHHDTLLMNTSCSGHVHILCELLRRGAHVNVTGKGGATALHMAAFTGRRDNVLLLLKARALTNIRTDRGKTPADEADSQGHAQIAQLLRAAWAQQTDRASAVPSQTTPAAAQPPANAQLRAFAAPDLDKKDRRPDDTWVRWVECPSADEQTRAAADARAAELKEKANHAYSAGDVDEAVDIWVSALAALGVDYDHIPDGANDQQTLDVERYPWRAVAVLCANVAQGQLKLVESLSVEEMKEKLNRGSGDAWTYGEGMMQHALKAACYALLLDPSYDKARHRLAAALDVNGDVDAAEHEREIMRDIKMYRAHTATNVAKQLVDVHPDVRDPAYPPAERMWPDRLIMYQVGLISARSLSVWAARDLPRVWAFLRTATDRGVLHFRCSLAEIDSWHSLNRQGVVAGEKNEYGSFTNGGQWLSIGLNSLSKETCSTPSRCLQLEQVWFARCDTTGAAQLDGPGMYSGGTAKAIDAAEAMIDCAVEIAQGEGFHVGTVLLGQGLKALTKRRKQFGPHILSGMMMPDMGHEAREAAGLADFGLLGLDRE